MHFTANIHPTRQLHATQVTQALGTAPPQQQRRLLRGLAWLSGGALALALAVNPVWAQTGTGTQSPGTSSGTTSGTAATLSEEDRAMIEDLAEANIAEIETGELALSKSQNPLVREFAQKMIDDHRSAQQELQPLAQSKGMTLPEETDLAHKTVTGALRLLTGDTFDSQYISRMGVDDHQRSVELLQKAQTEARDPEFRALAGRMLPVVQGHLDMARQINQQREQREQLEDRGQNRQQQGGTPGGSGMGTPGGNTGGMGGMGGMGGTR